MRKPAVLLFLVFLLPAIIRGDDAPAGDRSGFPRRPPRAELPPIGGDIPDWAARRELARVLSYAGRHEESIAEYRKLLRQKPDFVEAKLELAHVLHWDSRNEEALKIFDSLPTDKLEKKDVMALADILVAEGKFERAEKLYSGLLAESPEDRDMRMRYAEILSWTRQYDKALQEYEKLLAETPGDIQLRRKYALALQWAGRIDEAIRELKKTLDGQTE